MKMDKNREESPLVCVDDAVVVDSSDMDFDENCGLYVEVNTGDNQS